MRARAAFSFANGAECLSGCASREGGADIGALFDCMEALIAALEAAISPLLDRPFAFFGHSMGAGVAFELTRALRSSGRNLPRALFVSAARAPRLRTAAQKSPEPTDGELLAQLRQLGGLPEGPPDLMKVVLPVLRADLRLYRNHIFRPEAPLDLPVFAYRGTGDPMLRLEDVQACRRKRRGLFDIGNFREDIFICRTSEADFLKAFTTDQGEVMGDSRSDSAS